MFSLPQAIENSREFLILRTDILQKTVVGCSWWMTVTGDCLEVFSFSVTQSPFGFANVEILTVPTTCFIYNFQLNFGHLRTIEPVFVGETTPLCTYVFFSGRATLSGHDNPVLINLGDEQGIVSRRLKCCLVTNIITVSKNKKVITNATLFFTTNSTPRTEQCSRQWQQLPMQRPSNRRTKHDDVKTLHPAFNNK